MKKALVIILSVMLAVMCFATTASAADISVELDGNKLSFEQPPVIINERTLVPLRAIFEALNASVDWDDATKTVTSAKDDVTVKLTIGSNILYKNGEAKELDVPAQIVGEGYTMVPARAIAEAYGVAVDWNDATKTVILTSPKVEVPTLPTVEGELFPTINADTYTDRDYITTSGTAVKSLVVVENPLDPADKVFHLDANVTDKASWTYFWAKNLDMVPGERYIIEFDALLGDSVFDTKLEKRNMGICFKYAEDAASAPKDHGVGGCDIVPDSWTHIKCIYTVPSTIDASKEKTFGIYLNPDVVNGYDFKVAGDYYLDNISVVPYTGTLKDGNYNATKESTELDAFDIDAAQGLVYDFESDDCGFKTAGTWSPVVENGALTMTIPEDSNTDVATTNSDVNFSASEYKKVAFKIKGTSVDFDQNFVSIYFITDTDEKWNQDKSKMVHFANCKKTADGWYVGVADFTGVAGWTGTIKSLGVDPCQNVYGSVSIDKIVVIKE